MAEFGAVLEKAGFKKVVSSNGSATIYTKGGKSYSVRNGRNRKTGKNNPTADYRRDATSKQPDLKIRLKDDTP